MRRPYPWELEMFGPEAVPPARRPATRIGRTVVFPGGAVIQLSRTSRVLHALGLRKSLSTPHPERRSL